MHAKWLRFLLDAPPVDAAVTDATAKESTVETVDDGLSAATVLTDNDASAEGRSSSATVAGVNVTMVGKRIKFTCCRCDKNFVSSKALGMHVRRAHGDAASDTPSGESCFFYV